MKTVYDDAGVAVLEIIQDQDRIPLWKAMTWTSE